MQVIMFKRPLFPNFARNSLRAVAKESPWRRFTDKQNIELMHSRITGTSRIVAALNGNSATIDGYEARFICENAKFSVRLVFDRANCVYIGQ